MDYMKKLTTQEFIAKAIETHGDKYDYSTTQYKGTDAKVTIVCPEHGAFEQRACNHLLGRGCNRCSVDRNQQAQRLSQEAFVERARAVHGDRYEYPGKYVRMTAKVTIACREHGEFDLHDCVDACKEKPAEVAGFARPACVGDQRWV